MKKKTIALMFVVALAAFAVPALAFAGGMQAFAPAVANGQQTASTAYAPETKGEPAANAEPAVSSTPEPAPVVAFKPAPANACPGYADQDGDGLCDACGNGSGSCPGYTDADGDGVCDSYGSGACPGYTDADGNGVCDTYENGKCYGPGSGRHGSGYGNGNGHGCGGHGGCGRW